MSALASDPTLGTKVDARHLGEAERSYWKQLRRELEIGRLFRLAVIAAEFALVVAAIRLINIETRSVEQVLTVALFGFVVHHFLPATWRQNFFAALSVASVPMIFGWQQGTWLLGLGGLLIALCHVPIAFGARIALVALAAVAMAAERKQILPWASPVPTTIWPILASMFMFRLIVYIHDLRYGAVPFSPGRALSYFFMLPNVCFPLFPVVDYKTLQRSAYNDDALHLYQTGVKWMLRGLIHLALYKIVYLLVVIEPSEAVDGTGAARYMVATYLLYLKISGLFHLIVGLLHMYGFGLAETHHMYLFSSSYTDFWRRINIYWKDFIQKLVFNPIYFASRRLGDIGALVTATLSAFVVTWFFHSYQWFWIRGEFPIVWSDLVFWLGLGLVVMVNVLLESRRGRRRSLTKRVRTVREDVILVLKIAGTFASMCVLWTIWSTPKVEELGAVWRAVLSSGPLDLAVLLGVPLGMGGLGVLFGSRDREVSGAPTRTANPATAFWKQVTTVSAGAAAFIVVALWPGLLAPTLPALATLVKEMKHGPQLNAADSTRLQRGYYEELGDVTRFNNELWEMFGGEPRGWNDQHFSRARNDAIREEFIPSSVSLFKGRTLTVNRFGMRDREYPFLPGRNTYRIALVGSSHDLGAGVNDDETYENLVEDRLNRELGARTGKHFEILNFSYLGYTPVQKLSIIERRILHFKPDVILYVANRHEIDWMFRVVELQHLVKNQLLDQFPYVTSAMDRAGVTIEAGRLVPEGESALRNKLSSFAEDTLHMLLDKFRDASVLQGVQPALVILELPNDNPSSGKTFDRLASLGQSTRLPVLDLQGAFAGVADRTSLWVAPWDPHTNAEGHRLVADRLYPLLLEEGLLPTEGAYQGRRGG